jgi:hypothetical protein
MRCSRQRARSRSARTSGSGSQIVRHQLAAAQLGQHPGVDAVGLASQRRQPLYPQRVRDLDLPAAQLELVVDETGAVHRLDRRLDRRAETVEPLSQGAQAVGIRRPRADVDGRTLPLEQVKVETLATEIQAGVQHEAGPPLDSSQMTNRSLSPEEALFIASLTIAITFLLQIGPSGCAYCDRKCPRVPDLMYPSRTCRMSTVQQTDN